MNELTLFTEKQTVRNAELENDITTLEAIRTEQLKQQEDRHKDALETLSERMKIDKERHNEALERLSERKEVEKERELLALRTEYQSKLEKTNEDATAKIRDLYEQIRQLQQSKGNDKLRNR